jgi:SAM-dependent methyltransferase
LKFTTTGYDPAYHSRQFARPYESTVAFCNWLAEKKVFEVDARICDLGCGKGASLFYMASTHSNCQFTGLDLDDETISQGKEIQKARKIENCELMQGDLHQIGNIFEPRAFTGLISLQTLSWLPHYRPAINAMISLTPEWIAASSLFFDGPVETLTKVRVTEEAGAKTELFYNTYSLSEFRTDLASLGYGDFDSIPFNIKIDLPRPESPRMQTYTEKTADGRRLQISGPLLMNWYFVFARKSK